MTRIKSLMKNISATAPEVVERGEVSTRQVHLTENRPFYRRHLIERTVLSSLRYHILRIDSEDITSISVSQKL